MLLTCSAKGCSAPAAWSLLWNNPRIHAPERRKSWLACEEHRASLSDFLSARGFLRSVEPAPEERPEERPGDGPIGDPDHDSAPGSGRDPASDGRADP